MKITFIKPNIGKMLDGVYIDEGRMEPLMLGVLAGLTPSDVECVMYDDRMEAIPYEEATDLVAITVEIYTARRAYEIAAEYRARGVRVILGGVHPTLFPGESAARADSIFLGDAELGWAAVVEDARRGQLKARYEFPPGVAQIGGVQPRRDLFEGKGYLPMTLMQFSRGCRFVCDFCAISSYFKRRHYVRPTREVLSEIEDQAEEGKAIFFVDDNFLSDHEAAKNFLRELVPLKIRWVSQASIDMTRDLELMALLKESGCLGNVIGLESISPESIREMKKAPNLARGGWSRYEEAIDVLRDHNLLTWGAFTLGHDHDTLESIRETYDFAMHHRFTFAAFNILMPYPNTPLYKRLSREGRHLYDGQWWLHPEYRFNSAAFVPKHMSPDELTDAVWDIRRRWNKMGSMLYRLWDFKTHLHCLTRMKVYKYYVPLYAKEVYKKQGMLFGMLRDRVRPVKKARKELAERKAR
jgi:radical SAM superfamily enzyme YgiQ (UPF0313 family)